MDTIVRWLRLVLVELPQEVLSALWRFLLVLLLFLLNLLKCLWDRVRGKPHRRQKPRCNKVPESIKRKPDPCLYSQSYLLAQGQSVTWDNPDIWITLPDATAVGSSDLQPDTDYIVNVQIHDASFDPALATEVRCFYRPWSFNSPDTKPIETSPDGSEKVVVLHIPPWSSEIAKFRWHTPQVAGHYCLQAECRHVDDKNPNNNLGQENTNVVAGNPGETITAPVFLMNTTPRGQRFRIFVDRFTIPDGQVTLELKTLHQSVRSRRPFDVLHRAMLAYDMRARKLTTAGARHPLLIRYAYSGWEAVRKAGQRGQFPLEPAWQLRVEGQGLEEGWAEVALAPEEGRDLILHFKIPSDAARGSTHWLNFTATNALGKAIGGVSFEVHVNA